MNLFRKFIFAQRKSETKELGLKLKEIARRGFLGLDSQITIPGYQKGYLVGYVSEKMASLLAEELNRFSGIVAFYSDVKEFKEIFGESLYVTYDATDEEVT